MRKMRTAAAIAIAIGLSSALVAPAHAQSDIERALRGLLGGRGGSGLAANQGTIQANIQTGLSNISASLNSGVTSGQISLDERASLNAEFNRIQAMHSQFMFDGGYTNNEVQQILSAFSNMNNMIASATNNGIGTNIGTTFPGSIYNGNFGNFNQVLSLQNNVLSRINAGVASGALTRSEARILRDDYNRIAAQLNRRNVRGNLNMNPVVRRLVALDSRVTQMVNDNQFAGRGYPWF
jgi:hypothetical protein